MVNLVETRTIRDINNARIEESVSGLLIKLYLYYNSLDVFIYESNGLVETKICSVNILILLYRCQ